MKRHSVKWTLIVLLLFLMFPCGMYAAEDKPFTESIVVFNTICAKCHEAQCSGRLSFDDALEKSSRHILRHYGFATGRQPLQKELFDILNYMKEKCAYYPSNSVVPLKKDWGRDALKEFTTVRDGNYFLPVGHLSNAKYRLEIELEKDVRATVHLISENFEMVVEDCFDSSNSRIDIEFIVEDAGNYFFRMYPRVPVSITRLSITKSE